MMCELSNQCSSRRTAVNNNTVKRNRRDYWSRQIFMWDEQIISSWSRDVCTLLCNYGLDEAILNI